MYSVANIRFVYTTYIPKYDTSVRISLYVRRHTTDDTNIEKPTASLSCFVQQKRQELCTKTENSNNYHPREKKLQNVWPKKLADREGHLNRANTFNLISNALRCASLSGCSTEVSIKLHKTNRCRKARSNKTDTATNLQGTKFSYYKSNSDTEINGDISGVATIHQECRKV